MTEQIVQTLGRPSLRNIRLVPHGWRGWRRFISLPVLLIAWEVVARTGSVNPYLLPSVSAIAERWWSLMVSGELLSDLWATVFRAAISLIIAAAIGVPLGVAMSQSKLVHWFFDPLISLGFPMPKIAFLPIFILWFGFFDFSKIALTVFALIFPITSASYLAALGVEQQLLASATNMGTKGFRLIRRVVIPAAMPEILNGIQTALPLALIVVIVAELLSGGRGLGDSMMVASRYADSRSVFAGIVTIAVVGVVSLKLVALGRRHLLRWHEETSVE